MAIWHAWIRQVRALCSVKNDKLHLHRKEYESSRQVHFASLAGGTDLASVHLCRELE